MYYNINPYSRYQKGLRLDHLFPERFDGVCACGCNRVLHGRRRRWYSDECRQTSYRVLCIIKGDTSVIRHQLELVDDGVCRSCGIKSENWEADHILPVHKGGGGCYLDNFQTLCKSCHIKKTILQK